MLQHFGHPVAYISPPSLIMTHPTFPWAVSASTGRRASAKSQTNEEGVKKRKIDNVKK